MRWAYTQPVVEKDNRQSNFDLTTGQQILAAGRQPREPRALQVLQEGLRAAARLRLAAGEHWVVRGGYGISQYMEGTGANLRLPLNPPFFFESAVQYDVTTGAGHAGDRLRRPEAARPAVGPGARVGSEPAAAVHPAVERLRRVPADAVHVRQHRLRRAQREAPGDAGRRQPAAARRGRSVAPGRRRSSAVRCSRRRRSSPTSRRPRRAAAATTTRCRSACASATSTASSTSRRTR